MFGKKEETKVFANTETKPNLGKGVSQEDYDSMTKYYKTMYFIHDAQIKLAKEQINKADEMLKDSFKWNDLGAQTLRKAGIQRKNETEYFIQDLINKCSSYVQQGKMAKFW